MPPKSNYYPEEDTAAPAPDTGAPPDEETQDEGPETFLVNNSAFSGGEPKVGNSYQVKVVAMHDGQAECQVESEASPEEPEMGEMGNTRPQLPGGMGGAPPME